MKIFELKRTAEFDPEFDQYAAELYRDEYPYNGFKKDSVFVKRLENLGWKMLDYGLYSAVFYNSSKPYILKVNKRNDRAFSWFVMLTRKFPNKHFPIIGNMKIITIKHPPERDYMKYLPYAVGKRPPEKYYAYLIEKLYPLQTEVEKDVGSACNTITYNLENIGITNIQIIQHLIQQNFNKKVIQYFKDNEDLIDALKILFDNRGQKQFGEPQTWFDLGSNNVMKRIDGTIVISDPFAGFAKK